MTEAKVIGSTNGVPGRLFKSANMVLAMFLHDEQYRFTLANVKRALPAFHPSRNPEIGLEYI